MGFNWYVLKNLNKTGKKKQNRYTEYIVNKLNFYSGNRSANTRVDPFAPSLNILTIKYCKYFTIFFNTILVTVNVYFPWMLYQF